MPRPAEGPGEADPALPAEGARAALPAHGGREGRAGGDPGGIGSPHAGRPVGGRRLALAASAALVSRRPRPPRPCSSPATRAPRPRRRRSCPSRRRTATRGGRAFARRHPGRLRVGCAEGCRKRCPGAQLGHLAEDDRLLGDPPADEDPASTCIRAGRRTAGRSRSSRYRDGGPRGERSRGIAPGWGRAQGRRRPGRHLADRLVTRRTLAGRSDGRAGPAKRPRASTSSRCRKASPARSPPRSRPATTPIPRSRPKDADSPTRPADRASSRRATSMSSRSAPDFAPTGPPRPLTRQAAGIYGLTWTRDGRSIVYSSAHVGQDRGRLWRVAASGEELPERLEFAPPGRPHPRRRPRPGPPGFHVRAPWTRTSIDSSRGVRPGGPRVLLPGLRADLLAGRAAGSPSSRGARASARRSGSPTPTARTPPSSATGRATGRARRAFLRTAAWSRSSPGATTDTRMSGSSTRKAECRVASRTGRSPMAWRASPATADFSTSARITRAAATSADPARRRNAGAPDDATAGCWHASLPTAGAFSTPSATRSSPLFRLELPNGPVRQVVDCVQSRSLADGPDAMYYLGCVPFGADSPLYRLDPRSGRSQLLGTLAAAAGHRRARRVSRLGNDPVRGPHQPWRRPDADRELPLGATLVSRPLRTARPRAPPAGGSSGSASASAVVRASASSCVAATSSSSANRRWTSARASPSSRSSGEEGGGACSRDCSSGCSRDGSPNSSSGSGT